MAQWVWRVLGAVEGIEVGPQPALSIVVFRFVRHNQAEAVTRLRTEHDHFLTTTTQGGVVWVRLVVLGAAVSLESLETAVGAIAATAR